jgi:endogenous inhibitor of DNA gyrase (YacG/DUF329 family)
MARCPICGKNVPRDPEVARPPFCSARCKMVDLDNWLGGRYVVSEALPFDPGDAPVLFSDDGADEL